MSEPQSFLRKYIFSLDHKVIGIQYIVTGLAMGLIGAVLSALIRLQLGWPTVMWPILETLMPNAYNSGVMAPEFYLAAVTMHGTIMVFFFVSYVLVSGFGNFLVPLQVGARDMAFPLLNMLSYWIGLVSALVMLLAFFVEGGAAAAGWTAYPPLSALPAAVPGSGLGQSVWLVSMALFIVSFTMTSLNVVATVLSMRTKGMSMMRMPMTVWSFFIASVMGLLAFPALTAGAIMLLFDRHAGTAFFLPAGLIIGGNLVEVGGGSPLLWQHLFWFLGHPEVYVLILPALGVTFDILPAFTRKPIFGYRITIWSLVLSGFLGMIVWGHHMFVSGMSPFSGEYFSLSTLLITIPMAIVGVCMLGSLWGARLKMATPGLFILGLISMFGTGGFGGLFLGNATADIQLHDTYFVVGHFHLMIGGVTIFGMFAAIYFWFPKMFGRMMNEKLGRVHFWITTIGYYLIFLTQHFVGLMGAPRRYYSFGSYEYLERIATSNVFISIAAFVVITAQAVFLANFVWSVFRGKVAERNPWNATTLEWSLPSPPPHGNFATPPVVHRWPYEYSPDGYEDDFAGQEVDADTVPVTM